ncbi:PTS transporter subunit EIIB [Pseudomonas gingeri]|uniref:PTS transporter subunit EIIB n=1 Tax=Pseudomonas gingeri TaxID=117681 RepID=A0A7Y7YEA8_9PSED|nr:PTS transporter subunit EIIB [Pseudomonas gingeri]NWA01447.1 PTS transporter subunit EIIB [Pseudomonas gingeri]NWA13750.1 PTS transporter subunit EIIB [Pseudomonas gingeri]NWA52890.1 PTS transporter subunit EIIB [Pseudomonas gingeri]NWA96387.1 PTS transporter subunit EIIB [Pseudomonas gingeri]NWA99976.1 PTS transporter subunit EIIB [Pseudomonas gingeri]
MFDTLKRAFWKALTPDLVQDQSTVVSTAAVVEDIAAPILAALGGAANLKSRQRVALTRLRVELQDPTRLDQPALKAAGVPGVMTLPGGVVHLLVGLG